MDILNPFKQLITRFKSLLSTTDEDLSQDNFLDALRQTLSQKDFKGSVREIHPIHSQSVAVKKTRTLIKDLDVSLDSVDSAWPQKTLKRVMSAPPSIVSLDFL